MSATSPTPATWRRPWAGIRCRSAYTTTCEQTNTSRRGVDAGGTSEDKMAEIVMGHCRGELRASGLTTVGYVAQGQR